MPALQSYTRKLIVHILYIFDSVKIQFDMSKGRVALHTFDSPKIQFDMSLGRVALHTFHGLKRQFDMWPVYSYNFESY